MSDADPATDRPVPGRVLRPLQEFLSTESASATLLLLAALTALIWANSPWEGSYEQLWTTSLGTELGGWSIDLTLRHWVNEGLMTLFFLVVALEIKRELLTGELRDRRSAALPVVAAIGGMVVPALLYLLLTAGTAGSRGWGIPMATDIAFALGVLTLAARHAPANVKPFLLTLAIVDDIGAILVIALFYSGGVAVGWLAAAVAIVLVIVGLRRIQIRAPVVYVALGMALWLLTRESGLHPTIAGVVLGLLVPALPFERPRPPRRARAAVSPLARVEHVLLPWTSFVIVPIFALANAGVSLSEGEVGDALASRVTIGVVLGLVVGKVVGIWASAWVAVRMGIGRLPTGVQWSHLVGTAAVAGIGFTVSLFVAELAFDSPSLREEAKIGILVASVLAGAAGSLLLRRAPAAADGEAPRDDR